MYFTYDLEIAYVHSVFRDVYMIWVLSVCDPGHHSVMIIKKRSVGKGLFLHIRVIYLFHALSIKIPTRSYPR